MPTPQESRFTWDPWALTFLQVPNFRKFSFPAQLTHPPTTPYTIDNLLYHNKQKERAL